MGTGVWPVSPELVRSLYQAAKELSSATGFVLQCHVSTSTAHEGGYTSNASAVYCLEHKVGVVSASVVEHSQAHVMENALLRFTLMRQMSLPVEDVVRRTQHGTTKSLPVWTLQLSRIIHGTQCWLGPQ